MISFKIAHPVTHPPFSGFLIKSNIKLKLSNISYVMKTPQDLDGLKQWRY